MKRYERYKDSGVEWIGEIPSHWVCVKPQNLFAPVQREPEAKDEIVTCFRDGIVTLRRNRREEGFTTSLKEIGYQRVIAGDLVVHEMDGFAGSIGISDSTGRCTPVYTIIPPSSNNYNPYWMYLLREMANTGYIQCLSKSIRERTTEFRWMMWKGQLFPLPPLPEQHQIVSFLDEKTALIDDLIHKKEQKIALLKEYRSSLINRVVTKGLNPNAPMKDSGVEWIGEVPRHWRTSKFGFTSVITTGNTPSKGDESNYTDGIHLWVKPDELRGFYPTNDTKERLSDQGRDDTNVVPPYSVFVNGIGNIGRFGYSELYTSTNQQIHSISFRSDTIQERYGLYVISSMEDELNRQSETVVVSILTKTKLSKVPIPLPPLLEQYQLVSFLDEKTGEIDRTIESEQKKIELLKEYRQSLISSVVTGKIKVVD